MKKKLNLLLLAVLAVSVFAACEKTDDEPALSVEGTYYGKIQAVSGNLSHDGGQAVAVVTMMDSNLIHVHCYDSIMDTTFMLHHFSHHDSVMVCYADSAFYHMYGHMMGSGHMGGGMMGDMHSGQTQWMHHMEDEHMSGDEHFGGFDMNNHSFGYTFLMSNGRLHFSGTKK